jgi:hypothetical protein
MKTTRKPEPEMSNDKLRRTETPLSVTRDELIFSLIWVEPCEQLLSPQGEGIFVLIFGLS